MHSKGGSYAEFPVRCSGVWFMYVYMHLKWKDCPSADTSWGLTLERTSSGELPVFFKLHAVRKTQQLRGWGKSCFVGGEVVRSNRKAHLESMGKLLETPVKSALTGACLMEWP